MELTELVRAVLAHDALSARQWVSDVQRAGVDWSRVEQPTMETDLEGVVAAGLVELLAERAGQRAPGWTSGVDAASSDVFLVRAARTMPRLRRLCESDGPEPLRRRRLFAPPDFLTVA